MQRGDWVTLRAYRDEVIERRVVEVRGRTVYICTDEEYREADIEGREPVAVGFPIGAAIDHRPETAEAVHPAMRLSA